MAATIKLSLTPTEAALVWNLVDMQHDAGNCEGGNTPLEDQTLAALKEKLRPHHKQFSGRIRALSPVR